MQGTAGQHVPVAVKVLHVVTSSAFAGVERYVTYVAPRLVQRGWEVVVAGGDPVAMRAALSPSGIPHMRAATVLEATRCIAKHRRSDVIHAHMTSAEWAVTANRPFTRAATVSTRHFPAPRGRPGVVRAASRLVPHALDAQIAISAFVAERLGDATTVLLNGVPWRYTRPGSSATVLLLQRLEEEKCTEVALDAWAQSEARKAGWRMLVAGGGSLEPRLRLQARDQALGDTVEFLGRRGDTDELLADAGLLLATAPGEPFGLSVVEAMAAGVPVVAAAGGGHLETVGTCTTEFLFPPGDARACASRIDALVANSSAREAYGMQLQAHQRSRFDIESHVDGLLGIYCEAITRRSRREP